MEERLLLNNFDSFVVDNKKSIVDKYFELNLSKVNLTNIETTKENSQWLAMVSIPKNKIDDFVLAFCVMWVFIEIVYEEMDLSLIDKKIVEEFIDYRLIEFAKNCKPKLLSSQKAAKIASWFISDFMDSLENSSNHHETGKNRITRNNEEIPSGKFKFDLSDTKQGGHFFSPAFDGYILLEKEKDFCLITI
ncbi:MAG: hypothetical protein JXR68_14305 [Bacteroidales bacterium]|nr:hypothetical protein [Bacteroidales bacterium]